MATLVTEIFAPAGDRTPEYKYVVRITKTTMASMTSETRLKAGKQTDRYSIPGRVNRLITLSVLRNVKTGFGSYLVSYSISIMHFPGVRRPKREPDDFLNITLILRISGDIPAQAMRPHGMHKDKFTVIMSGKRTCHQNRSTG
jgi:hypothetical protein